MGFVVLVRTSFSVALLDHVCISHHHPLGKCVLFGGVGQAKASCILVCLEMLGLLLVLVFGLCSGLQSC